MKVPANIGVALIIVCSILALSPASAQAACSNINSLPKNITASGCYTLNGNLTIAGDVPAITIGASDVVLDLGGYFIKNTNVSNTAVGIYTDGVSNITIKNGSIVNFAMGISDFSAQLLVVNNIVIDMKTAGLVGIGGGGNGHLISNCRINGNPAVLGANGINYGSDDGGANIINNDFINLAGDAIDIGGSGGVVLDNNRITNYTLLPGEGISLHGGEGVVVTRNVVINKALGMNSYAGVTGVYRDNIVTGCTTPYDMQAGMVNAGNNQ